VNKKQLGILVDESYKELVALLKWFANFGPIPTIIGGWAVYFYNPYFGSIDIDIVSPSHQGRFTDLIEQYERTHGYEFTSREPLGLELTSRKPIIREGKTIGYMEIDACTFEDPKPRSFHEDPSKQLRYSLVAEKKYQREITLENGAMCYIPCKPLLLLYKIKAARDRAWDLKTYGTTMDPAKTETLRGKLTKDRADILALLDPKPTKSMVKENLSTTSFHKLVDRLNLDFILATVRELPTHPDAIRLYNPSLQSKQVEKWIKSILIV